MTDDKDLPNVIQFRPGKAPEPKQEQEPLLAFLDTVKERVKTEGTTGMIVISVKMKPEGVEYSYSLERAGLDIFQAVGVLRMVETTLIPTLGRTS